MPAATARILQDSSMSPVTFARTVGNAVIALLMCFALFVCTRRAIHAWTTGEIGERIFWSLVVLGAALLSIRAIRRTRDAARPER
jgi:hypothetical protein